MGIDYGDSRIGIAVSDALGIIATPVEIYKAKGMRVDIDYLSDKAKALSVEKIIFGLPINMDGTEGERAEKCRKVGAILGKVSGIEVIMKDERLTTVAAERVLDEANMRWDKRKKVVDIMEAQLILQSYLDLINRNKNNKE